MTQSSIQTWLQLLTLHLLVLVVSTQRATSSSAPSYVLKGWVPNACTLVVCAPQDRGPEDENRNPGFQGPTGAPSSHRSHRHAGSRHRRFRRDANQSELDCLRKEIRDLQAQLNAFNETLKVLLMPNGVMVGGKIFKTDGSTGDYETAKNICSQMGAMIASPRNAAENKAVQQIVQWQNRKALLGISDAETEGRFVDPSGVEVRYSNWAPGEPNNLENEDCVEMHLDGRWHDRRCGFVWLVICEF
ncbi:pulmonary surfactant-associated protein D-like [Paroedura picta]|uniref:pulmonary surfactant-associated protein D-like n=1 Tax=Paroedura picta TaxID=143630 RepID=UPI0040579CA3